MIVINIIRINVYAKTLFQWILTNSYFGSLEVDSLYDECFHQNIIKNEDPSVRWYNLLAYIRPIERTVDSIIGYHCDACIGLLHVQGS